MAISAVQAPENRNPDGAAGRDPPITPFLQDTASMSWIIPAATCSRCGTCVSSCPYGAISQERGQVVIDPAVCHDCNDQGERPFCVITCPISLPRAAQARRGRGRLLERDSSQSDTPQGDVLVPFASCLPVWEAANLLAQGVDACGPDPTQSLIERESQQVWLGLGLSAPLRADVEGNWASPAQAPPLPRAVALKALTEFDPRAVALHLILSSRAAGLQQPWAETITIDDRELEERLGLSRRRDLNRPERLSLIKSLMLQLCRLTLQLRCTPLNNLPELELNQDPFWRLLALEHHFQSDHDGQNHLAGLTFQLRPGGWSRYFLNPAGQREHRSLYQYGHLPAGLPRTVMRHWQQHPGAVRLLVWLPFKLRLGQQHTLLVSTLMRIAYGSQRIAAAASDRELRKRLVRAYETDLLVLLEEGLRPRFHPQLYPDAIRPLWHSLEAIPDDPDEALAYWIRDGASEKRLTDTGPRNKYHRLLQARIQGFERDRRWQQSRDEPSERRHAAAPLTRAETDRLQADEIQLARRRSGLSQRALATLLQRSQSWVRDLESGRCKASLADQGQLRQVLGIGSGR